MIDPYVVVLGRLAIGVFQVTGPFEGRDAALAWAAQNVRPPTDWLIQPLIAPSVNT